MSAIELNKKIQELRELRRMAEEIQSEIDAITDLFKAEMSTRSTDELAGTDWKVSWKPVTSSRLDTAALKKELPEVVERFSKTTTVRRFSIA